MKTRRLRMLMRKRKRKTLNENNGSPLSNLIYFENSEVGVNLDRVLYFTFYRSKLYFYYDNKTITITDVVDIDAFRSKIMQ